MPLGLNVGHLRIPGGAASLHSNYLINSILAISDSTGRTIGKGGGGGEAVLEGCRTHTGSRSKQVGSKGSRCAPNEAPSISRNTEIANQPFMRTPGTSHIRGIQEKERKKEGACRTARVMYYCTSAHLKDVFVSRPQELA